MKKKFIWLPIFICTLVFVFSAGSWAGETTMTKDGNFGFTGFSSDNPFSQVLAKALSAGGRWTLKAKSVVYYMVYRSDQIGIPERIVLISKQVGDIMGGVYFRSDVRRYYWEVTNWKTEVNLEFFELKPEAAMEKCQEFLTEIEQISENSDERNQPQINS